MSSFEARSKQSSLKKQKRSKRQAFMELFTTSPLGLGIRSGAGDRGHGVQSKFRSQLLKDYNGLNDNKDA
ncbi:uncharacterized protein ASPGLDRAFT_45773 [Aspergillus glaucus CBS 516.65]|uniref:Uncharacterized protein n=1 Tax=Aspergillus glaucus CBS 516.65 TaxID=1160497 RepID=A0A1L9VP97_ASPGL|nr:hypothetical protein ASPGLDRAFT_45773 [Aspergillus glaucus CBS 516.65]OJJ85747.1 hypothetical protein ASPGLDRAFT_45773 [Aspergillus glaucus CBS 516.65]